MSATDIQIFLASIGGLLVILAGGTKWLLTHIETLQMRASMVEAASREKLADRLHDEIRALRRELEDSQTTSRLYLKRIHQLEAFVHRHFDVELPELDGWPPI